MDADRTHRYTVRDAAEVMGISAEAVRARIRRGTVESEKDPDGTVYVVLRHDRTHPDSDGTTGRTSDRTELVEALRGEVEHLRAELQRREERHEEEIRRRDHLLAAALARIPELPPQQPRDSRESARQDAGGYEAHQDERGQQEATQRPAEAPEGERRSWWRRIFGG